MPKTPADKPARPEKTTKPSRTAKGAAAKVTAAKPAAVKPATGPKLDASAAVPAKAAVMKVKELVDAVATATGSKKPETKKTIEATLSALADALKSGSVLALPPLGRVRVAKSAEGVMTLKLRLADAPKAGGKPLADDGEDD